MVRKQKVRLEVLAGISTLALFGLIGMYFYNDRSVIKVISCFETVPSQVYWAAGLGVLLTYAGIGFHRLDKNTATDFEFDKMFIDPQTHWPVFTNVVLSIVLIFSLSYVVLLAFYEQWKLGVEVVEAIITGFVAKFAVATFSNNLQSVITSRWKDRVKDEQIGEKKDEEKEKKS